MTTDGAHAGDLFELHAEMCKVFSHPLRLRILDTLRDREMGVSELAKRLGVSIGSLSQHLGMMKERRALASRKDGNHVLYRVANPRLVEAFDLMRGILHEQIRGEAALLPVETSLPGATP
ncbi:MAG: winged helix-turn-helix transcriptional regulator [Armatimonadetes bacterium]|nr:winged helix-turn-helix transcriptional regulator [Armatimonadota bacterium]